MNIFGCSSTILLLLVVSLLLTTGVGANLGFAFLGVFLRFLSSFRVFEVFGW